MTTIVGSSFWALSSGTLGAAASCFAKLAFSSNDKLQQFLSVFTKHQQQQPLSLSCPLSLSEWITCFHGNTTTTTTTTTGCLVERLSSCHVLPRLVCAGAMIACNAAMVACLVGGLQHAGSVAGTALSTAANFLASVAAGYWLWNEQHETATTNTNYYTMGLGLALVVTGTILLVWAQQKETENETIHKHPTSHDNDKKIS